MAGSYDVTTGVGTVYASTIKDAGVKTKREFEITEFEPPRRIRWKELSKGRGLGKLIAPLALRGARSSADQFGQAIKAAVEAS